MPGICSSAEGSAPLRVQRFGRRIRRHPEQQLILHDAKAHRAGLVEHQPTQHLPLISPAIRQSGRGEHGQRGRHRRAYAAIVSGNSGLARYEHDSLARSTHHRNVVRPAQRLHGVDVQLCASDRTVRSGMSPITQLGWLKLAKTTPCGTLFLVQDRSRQPMSRHGCLNGLQG